MKKEKWLIMILTIVLLLVFFLPIPRGSLDDGGTRDYIALTYRIVDWNRISADGVYQKTRIYFGDDRKKTIDELWELEHTVVDEKFVATILEINGSSVLVEPIEGERERLSSDKITFGIDDLEKIDVKAGDLVEVTYTGVIMESYPAQIRAIRWKLLDVQ